MTTFGYLPGPVYFPLFACIMSAIADAGPIVNASVGNELGPHTPDNVPSLTIRQAPPAVIRDFGFSMVTVGSEAA